MPASIKVLAVYAKASDASTRAASDDLAAAAGTESYASVIWSLEDAGWLRPAYDHYEITAAGRAELERHR